VRKLNRKAQLVITPNIAQLRVVTPVNTWGPYGKSVNVIPESEANLIREEVMVNNA
jgi:hypothetical protein